jgi:hypothetical protein
MVTEQKEPTQRCVYCGKVKPQSEMFQHTIIGRGRKWDNFRNRDVACVVEFTNWYCKGTSCAQYDQYAHEG